MIVGLPGLFSYLFFFNDTLASGSCNKGDLDLDLDLDLLLILNVKLRISVYLASLY